MSTKKRITLTSTLRVRNLTYTVEVDTDGQFYTKVGELELHESSREKLEALVTEQTKPVSKKLDIEFYRWRGRYGSEGEGLEHGRVTGRHAANDNLLIKWEGKKGVEQESKPGRGRNTNGYFLKLDLKEVKEYTELRTAQKAIEEQIETFHTKHGIDVRKIMDDAEQEAIPSVSGLARVSTTT